jgi:GT2 family glycosyltransferase/glycosyltransferase involved in cell wall biosynthesis
VRVLLVVHGFPPASCAGTEIYTHDLERALRQHADVAVIAREADPDRPDHDVRRERRDGRRLYFVNNTFRACRAYEQTYNDPQLGAVVAQLVDEINPQVVHIQHLIGLGAGFLPWLDRRGIPTVFTLNDFWLLCHRGQLLDTDLQVCDGPATGCGRCLGPVAGTGAAGYRAARLLDLLGALLPAALSGALRSVAHRGNLLVGSTGRAEEAARNRQTQIHDALRGVDLFLAPSRTVRGRFLELGIEEERIVLLPQGIDCEPFAGLRRQPGGCLRLGFVGSLMVSKAPHLLLEAVAGLPPGAVSVDLFGPVTPYHGDDRYHQVLAPLMRLPGVRHHGAVIHEEIPRALAALDLLVVPSIWLENAPFVIHEAHAAGLPVIASNHGGMAEMVRHEHDGLLFRPGDAEDLRRTLRRLLDDPALLERLRRGIPSVMSIEQDALQLLAVYERVIHGRARRARAAAGRPTLAAVVVNHRTPVDTLLACWSLESSARPPDQLIVVDNASGDGSAGFLRQRLPRARLLETSSNIGFAAGCNRGIREALAAGADLVFLLGSDALVRRDTLGRLEAALGDHSRAGIAGPVILSRGDPRRSLSHGIRFSGLTGRMRHEGERQPASAVREVAAVDGCAMLIRRELLERVGLFDERYFLYFEDVDLCRRAATQGLSSVVVADAVAYHEGGRSFGPGSPLRLYHSTRGHLRAVARVAAAHLAHRLLRAGLVVGFNAAHALTERETPALAGLQAVLRGALDHLQGA